MSERPVANRDVEITPASDGRTRLTITYAPRELRIVSVADTELEALAASGGGVYLALFGVSFGVLVTVATTLATVPLAEPKSFATFVALTFTSALLSVLFGFKAWQDHSRVRKKLKELKEGPV